MNRLETLIAPPEAPPARKLFAVNSGSGYWLVMDQAILWHHYSGDYNSLGDLEKITQNALTAAGVPWQEAPDINDLWQRLDRLEERTGTPAVDLLELMLARGRF